MRTFSIACGQSHCYASALTSADSKGAANEILHDAQALTPPKRLEEL